MDTTAPRGPGQPRIGTRTVITLPDDLLAEAAQQAAKETARGGTRVTRSEILRRWVMVGMNFDLERIEQP